METAEKTRIVLDARGSFCPGPLMELVRGIRQAQVGEELEVWSSDQGSRKDIPFWVQKAGHELVGAFDQEGYTRFVVKKLR
ncbi:MAG TPA: sulfurtransferase TusA family protein [Thermoplasmata archaeon]